MDKQPKVSVIIPVYNVEKYLSECLDSVVNQNFDNIEIICINDGSKDSSLQILEEYAKKDSRICLINKENAGVSAARNDGLKQASGKYIAFLDGDDYWEPDCLARIYEEAEANNSDVAIFAHNLIENDKKIAWDNPMFKDIRRKIDLSKDVSLYAFAAVIWNKLYRTDFIRKNKIVFPAGVKIAEDTIFSLECYFNEPSCCYLAEHFYNYRINRKDSATADSSCIQGEVTAFKAIEKMPFYQRLPQSVKLRIVEKFVSGVEGHLNRFSLQENEDYMKIRNDFVAYLMQNYDSAAIRRMTHLNKLKFVERIFSLKNSHCKKYKIIRFLGFKIKIRRKS